MLKILPVQDKVVNCHLVSFCSKMMVKRLVNRGVLMVSAWLPTDTNRT